MGIIDRFVLFIYSFAMFVVAAIVLSVCTQFVSQGYLWEVFVDYIGGSASLASMVAAGAAGFWALLSLYLLKVSVKFPRSVDKKKNDAVVVHGGIGDVRITVEAVKNLVDKKARNVKGVRDAKVQVEVKASADKEEIKIRTALIVGQEHHIPEVSDQVRGAIQESLTNVVGLTEFKLEIVVDDISNTSVQKQRVV